jgi:dihydroceramidase
MAAMVWSWDVSQTIAYCIYAGLSFAAVFITVVYMHIKDPTFHQVAYAFLTGLVITRSMYLLHTRVDNGEARKNMMWAITIGVGSFLTGFILWIIDNECCDALRSVRHQIGIPWAFLLGTPFGVVTDSRTSWVVVESHSFDF